jgi:beta-galactosidase
MKREILCLFAASMLAAHGASRESFDSSWKFARFGEMPDGSHLAEPGTPAKTAMASSYEADHPADHATDGNPETRWCAASAAPNQSLTLDLGRVGKLGGIEFEWEKPAVYPYKVDVSADGKQWKMLEDRSANTNASGKEKLTASASARFVRVTVGAVPATQWASIREIRALDAAGAAVKPAPPAEASGPSPSAADFDDSQWRSLNLPHDWGVEGPFRMDLENETGKLPWAGIGWYRKTLDLTAADQGKAVFLDFDGAMSMSKVFVNGKQAGEWAYGYNSFRIDLTPFVKPGGKNTIAVRIDNLPKSSRWYPGGGIYRHVWLVKANLIHIAYNGIFARSENITPDSADVVVSVELDIQGPISGQKLDIIHELLDASGKIVASGKSIDAEPARLKVKSPTLWSTEKPYLYTLRTTLVRGDQKLDSKDTPIGIRTAEWKPDGFYLNGSRIQIKGVCNHHDLGAIGSAFNTRAAERQIEILKDMGCNSIRTSHNPPAPQLLDLCDRMGILVLDELFDAWKMAKKPNDYHLHFDAWHERDVANFIRRDRNHPCVIAWSTGNEIPEQGNKSMHWVSEKLTSEIRKHDSTRMITAGCNNLASATNGFVETVDILGFNYPVRQPKLAAEIHAKKPKLPILSTETASCVSSRGCYYFPVKWDKGAGNYEFQVSSYELSAPGWANRPDLDFELLEKNPFIAGEYVWTGFDYFGEPTPYNNDTTNALNFQNPEERAKAMEELKKLGGKAPSRSSYFGILDLAGFPKDRFYLYQAHWRPEMPMAHILPHWNWPERVGQVTPVHVFTSGDEAELFLNGKSLGRKKKEQFTYRIVWEDVTYQPGTLTVKTWKNGKPWAEGDRSTTGTAAKLSVTADRPEIKADGDDLCYVTVTIADEKGRLVPRSMNRLQFKVDGDAEIAAVCNGDATSHEPQVNTNTLKAFNGLCQVVLRGKAGKPGTITLSVASENLPVGKVTITTK